MWTENCVSKFEKELESLVKVVQKGHSSFVEAQSEF
jgi:hypothetical protein